MSQKVIDELIINNPYEEPKYYWSYIREIQEFEKKEGRRKAGYWKSSNVGKTKGSFDDPGEFVEIELVNKIRPRVKEWREKGYPNVTGVTKKLLEFWKDKEAGREYQFFFCQLEAVETAIWLTEATDAEKQGIEITSDGSLWERQCLKLATGAGKTVVMAMLIAWQVLNKIANLQDTRFSKNVLVVAPGITVRDRLQVLLPRDPENFYNSFSIVPNTMLEDLRKGTIRVKNWHTLAPIKEDSGPKVIKKGPESDEAFCRRVLSDFGNAKDILIINDEAHHCHRPKEDEEEDKSEEEKATIWISGIDKIHNARGILKAYDLTATPFKPTGLGGQDEKLFAWIVSDFGLNDAIESGLVKTPKIAVRDDSVRGMLSDFFHIYPKVKEDLNRRVDREEGLPDLVRNAINVLGADWLRELDFWNKYTNLKVPPVMIVVCNRIETAARVEYAIENGYINVTELSYSEGLLRIDQDALDKIESEEEEKIRSKKELVQLQRNKFNTVGKIGKPGENIRCVIGVNMLSEGWDARTVTHILGLRAFTSQLLCEQVIGRGLRRISYDINEKTNMFQPDYVSVFGIPFTFLPVEGESEGAPKEETPKTKIEPRPERQELEIKWPHVLRVEYKLNYFLDLDWDKLKPLEISTKDCQTIVDMAPVIDGKPDFSRLETITLEKLAESSRFQTTKLHAVANLQKQLAGNWSGDIGSQINQLFKVVDQFIESDKLVLKLPPHKDAELMKRIAISLNIQKITHHISNFIRRSSKESPIPIYDPERPVRSTASSMTWYTSRPTQPVRKSQISHIVVDSMWETVGFEFERDRISGLLSWAKNDHLGFEIFYIYEGSVRKYYPDFLIKFEGNQHMILEVKGKKREEDEAKWQVAEEWVKAINSDGRFGHWEFKVLKNPKDLFDVVRKPMSYNKEKLATKSI